MHAYVVVVLWCYGVMVIVSLSKFTNEDDQSPSWSRGCLIWSPRWRSCDTLPIDPQPALEVVI
jgi:hypothetical protein